MPRSTSTSSVRSGPGSRSTSSAHSASSPYLAAPFHLESARPKAGSVAASSTSALSSKSGGSGSLASGSVAAARHSMSLISPLAQDHAPASPASDTPSYKPTSPADGAGSVASTDSVQSYQPTDASTVSLTARVPQPSIEPSVSSSAPTQSSASTSLRVPVGAVTAQISVHGTSSSTTDQYSEDFESEPGEAASDGATGLSHPAVQAAADMSPQLQSSTSSASLSYLHRDAERPATPPRRTTEFAAPPPDYKNVMTPYSSSLTLTEPAEMSQVRPVRIVDSENAVLDTVVPGSASSSSSSNSSSNGGGEGDGDDEAGSAGASKSQQDQPNADDVLSAGSGSSSGGLAESVASVDSDDGAGKAGLASRHIMFDSSDEDSSDEDKNSDKDRGDDIIDARRASHHTGNDCEEDADDSDEDANDSELDVTSLLASEGMSDLLRETLFSPRTHVLNNAESNAQHRQRLQELKQEMAAAERDGLRGLGRVYVLRKQMLMEEARHRLALHHRAVTNTLTSVRHVRRGGTSRLKSDVVFLNDLIHRVQTSSLLAELEHARMQADAQHAKAHKRLSKLNADMVDELSALERRIVEETGTVKKDWLQMAKDKAADMLQQLDDADTAACQLKRDGARISESEFLERFREFERSVGAVVEEITNVLATDSLPGAVTYETDIQLFQGFMKRVQQLHHTEAYVRDINRAIGKVQRVARHTSSLAGNVAQGGESSKAGEADAAMMERQESGRVDPQHFVPMTRYRQLEQKMHLLKQEFEAYKTRQSKYCIQCSRWEAKVRELRFRIYNEEKQREQQRSKDQPRYTTNSPGFARIINDKKSAGTSSSSGSKPVGTTRRRRNSSVGAGYGGDGAAGEQQARQQQRPKSTPVSSRPPVGRTPPSSSGTRTPGSTTRPSTSSTSGSGSSSGSAVADKVQFLDSCLGHSGAVTSVAVSAAEGSKFASSSVDWSVRIWRYIPDAQCSVAVHEFPGHKGAISHMQFHPTQPILASVSSDNTMRLWHTSKLRPIKNMNINAPGSCCCFSPDGRRIAVAAYKSVQLWDVETGLLVRTSKPLHDMSIYSLAYHPDRNVLATGGDDRWVKLTDADSGSVIDKHREHGSWVWSTSFSQDGQTIVSGAQDGSLVSRDWAGECTLAKVKAHSKAVQCVTLDQDRVYSCSADATVKVWSVGKSGALRARQTLREHSGTVSSAAMMPQHGLLLTGGTDKVVRLWQARQPVLERRDGLASPAGSDASASATSSVYSASALIA